MNRFIWLTVLGIMMGAAVLSQAEPLSVQNGTFDARIKVAPSGAQAVSAEVHAKQYLGDRWRPVDNNIRAGLIGASYAPSGATGTQFLNVDGRGGGTGWLLYLGETAQSGPVSLTVNIAARKDLPAADYSLSFLRGSDASFTGLTPVIEVRNPTPAVSTGWNRAVLTAESVPAGTHLYLQIKAEDSGAAPKQTLMDDLQVREGSMQALPSAAEPSGNSFSKPPVKPAISALEIAVQNGTFDDLKIVDPSRNAALMNNGQVSEYIGDRWQVMANKGAAGLLGANFAPPGATGTQFLYIDSRGGGTVWVAYLGKKKKSGPVSVSMNVASRKDLPGANYTIELAGGADASFRGLASLVSKYNPVSSAPNMWNRAVVTAPEVSAGTYLYLVLKAEDSGSAPQQILFDDIQVLEQALAPSKPVEIKKLPEQKGLYVQNSSYNGLKALPAVGVAGILNQKQASELLGDRWLFEGNPSTGGGILGANYGPPGAKASQFLYVDGRNGGCSFTVYLGEAEQDCDVGVRTQVAGRKDLPAAGYRISLLAGTDDTFGGLTELVSQTDPVTPSSSQWQQVALIIQGVPNKTPLYLQVKALSAAAAQQTLFDTIQTAVRPAAGPVKPIEKKKELNRVKRDFGISNGTLAACAQGTRTIAGQADANEVLGPFWQYDDGAVGVTDASSTPPLPAGQQALFLGAHRSAGRVVTLLGKLDKVSDVSVHVEMARRRGVPDAHHYVMLFMADNDCFENLTMLTGRMNPVPIYNDRWTPFELTAQGVPKGKYIYLCLQAKAGYRRYEEVAFSQLSATARPAARENPRWTEKPLFNDPAGPLPDVYSYRAGTLAELKKNFSNPPQAVGPWVYWFWFDNAIEKSELTRQIEEMVSAGIAGAEIRCIRGVVPNMQAMQKQSGHSSYEYLSDEWMDRLQYACAEAERTGFKLSFNMGMGWPPGGMWVTSEHQLKQMVPSSRRVQGPQLFAEKFAPRTMVMAWQIEGERGIKAGSGKDLTDRIDEGGRLRWRVPEGDWVIGIYHINLIGFVDKGEGVPADPGSKEALKAHMDHLFARFDKYVGKYYGSTIVDVATDSWEYGNDNNWSPGIVEQFPNTVGYALKPKMYAWLGYGTDRDQILHDYKKVMKVTVRENYFRFITDYLNQRGLRHRPQVRGHGLERDLFEAYANCDVPEMEEEIYVPEGVWAAHIQGKPVVSAESMTFTAQQEDYVNGTKWGPKVTYQGVKTRNGWDFSSGTWRASPELIFRHSASHYAKGVNRIQLHSYSYTPKGVDPMVWRMYAPIHLNGSVPWWPYMRSYTDWSRRSQYVLQSGSPESCAVVYPVESVHRHNPVVPFRADQPSAAMNGVDAASKYIFPQLKPLKGDVAYDFESLMLIGDIETAGEVEKIVELIGLGKTVYCCKMMPQRWTAFDKADEKLRTALQTAVKNKQIVDATVEDWGKVTARIRKVQWPAGAELQYQHRMFKDGDLYYIRNGGNDFDGEVTFSQQGVPELWDAADGRVYRLEPVRSGDGKVSVHLKIPAADVVIVTFCKKSTAPSFTHAGSVVEIQEISGPWRLSAKAEGHFGIDSDVSLMLETLKPWRQISELHDYAGVVTYEKEIILPENWRAGDARIWLDAGTVCELAHVRINGKDAGNIWHYPYELDITDYLKPGTNKLVMEVPNVLLNYEARDAENYPRPSGLLGPVRLQIVE